MSETKVSEKIDEKQEKMKASVEAVAKPTTKKAFYERFSLFQVIVIFCFLGFAMLTALIKFNPSLALDVIVTRSIQQITFPGFDALMRLITYMGDLYPGVITALVIALFFAASKRYRPAGMLLLSVLGANIISLVFKAYVARPRPDPELITQISQFKYNDSFPSGHVLFFMGLYGFLLFLAFTRLKRTWIRKVLLIILFSLLVLMGVSRIYLGAHWFSDTLGSYLIGIVWLYIMDLLYKRLVRKNQLTASS